MDEQQVRLELYVPADHLATIVDALHRAGAGRVGMYDHTFAVTEVTGHWRPLDGAAPYQGQIGQLSAEPELKVEMRCPQSLAAEAVRAARAAHPYEEPVIDVIALIALD
jgi:hypothetical protein